MSPRCERGDLVRVLVDADDVHAEVGQARARDEAHVAGADHADVHALSSALHDAAGGRCPGATPRSSSSPSARGDAGPEPEDALGLLHGGVRDGTSPGWSGWRSSRARLPVAASTAATSSASVTGCAPPRLTMSKPSPALERRLDAVGDVVDVRVVAPRAAVAVEGDRLVRLEAADEPRDRHLRALPRAVHGEEPQAHCRQAVEVVGVEDLQLARALGRRVGGDRPVDRVLLGERQLRVDPVDRRRRGEDEARLSVRDGRLEQVQRRDAVDLLVEDRLGRARAARPPAPRGGATASNRSSAKRRKTSAAVADVALDQAVARVGAGARATLPRLTRGS